MANKILIANRGEIAIRIIRACKELGINCVSVYSEADEFSLHVKLADEAICIGEASSSSSYLNMNNIISAAIATGCNAIHPGYGFLSENSKFASLIEKCNLLYIGPNSQIIDLLSDKTRAKSLAKKCGIPIIADSDGAVASIEEGICAASRIGYPLLIKAVFGGGGKGITLVHDDNELIAAFTRTRFEAEKNFGSAEVFLEKYISNPRHVEVQVLADKMGNVISLGERDCSLQRRNQKIIEETPSPVVSSELRNILSTSALRLIKEVGYEGCATVEYLLEGNNYYFLEVNTRIQVEHPITEEVTGIDIVKEQIQIAYGQSLSIKQEGIVINGHALECRIMAEDPDNDFRPSPGLINNVIFPGGMGVRVESHIYPTYQIPPYYDALIAKIIVHAPTRREAIRKMRTALEQFIVDGIKTNVETLYLVMYNTDFVRGVYNTSFINNFVEIVKANKHE